MVLRQRQLPLFYLRGDAMAILYKTVKNAGMAESVVEKSKFIVNLKPVECRSEAEEFFKEIKKIHKDATHNVPAFILGDKQQEVWASDDGEPQGTAGVPIVRMLEQEGVTNLCLVVTRYFGGIKLGTGGLVRAYTNIAKSGLEKAGKVEVLELEELTFQIEYTYYSKMKQLDTEGKFQIAESKFEDNITLCVRFEPEKHSDILNLLNEITNGSVTVLNEEKVIGKRDL